MNNIVDRDREYKEKMADAMLEYVARTAKEELLDEMDDADEVVFSERHEKEMEKLFASMEKKTPKVVPLKRVLILVAVLVGVLAVGAIATKPIVLNLLQKSNDTYTEIRFDEAEVKNGMYSNDSVTLGYVPDGMKLVESTENEKFTNLMFQNDEIYFQIRIQNVDGFSDLDNESSYEDTIMIWGKEAHFQERDGNISLAWSTETQLYMLFGNLSKEELIKIAENIQ